MREIANFTKVQDSNSIPITELTEGVLLMLGDNLRSVGCDLTQVAILNRLAGSAHVQAKSSEVQVGDETIVERTLIVTFSDTSSYNSVYTITPLANKDNNPKSQSRLEQMAENGHSILPLAVICNLLEYIASRPEQSDSSPASVEESALLEAQNS